MGGDAEPQTEEVRIEESCGDSYWRFGLFEEGEGGYYIVQIRGEYCHCKALSLIRSLWENAETC